MDLEFGNTQASLAFLERNRELVPKLERLISLGNRCLGRVHKPKNVGEDICFGLGQACREDFLEALFLAANGYSNGALKIVRGIEHSSSSSGHFNVRKPEMSRGSS